jgi:ATP:corrinoid adenosyltransferase
MADDTCIVGYLVRGLVDPKWEVFPTGDTRKARDLWRAKHGTANDEDLSANSYNELDVALAYGIIPVEEPK